MVIFLMAWSHWSGYAGDEIINHFLIAVDDRWRCGRSSFILYKSLAMVAGDADDAYFSFF